MTKRLLPIFTATAMGMALAATANAQATLNPGNIYPSFPVTVYLAGPCDGTDQPVLMPFQNFGLVVGDSGAASITGVDASVWFNGASNPYTIQYANVAVGPGTGPQDDHVVMFVDPTTRRSGIQFGDIAPEFEPGDHVAFHMSCTGVPSGWQALVKLDFVDNANH